MNDNDSGTEYDDSQIQGDDEAGFEDNSEHEERDADVQLGKKIAREKKYHASRVVTVSANPLDAELLPQSGSEEETSRSAARQDSRR